MLISEIQRLQKQIGGVVTNPKDVQAIIEAIGIEEEVSAFQDRAGKTKRAQHTKQHGTVEIRLNIDPDLAPELQVGIFEAGAMYKGMGRLSNGATQVGPDDRPGSQGFAIKLPGQAKENLTEDNSDQDFIMMSYPFFFLSTMQQVAEAMKAQVAGKEEMQKFFQQNPEVYKLMQKQKGYWLNPLWIQYYSVTPYSFGDRKIKYSLNPRISPQRTSYQKSDIPADASANYLQEAMAKTLASKPVEFDFLVQFYQDENTTPIDDTMVVWPTPFHKLGTLTIPQQYFTAPGQLKIGELASFSPWHCRPDHKPLGSINIGRRFVYSNLSDYRHDRNKVAPNSPQQNPLNLVLKIRENPVTVKSASGEIVVATKGIVGNYQALRAALTAGGTGLNNIKTIHFARNLFFDPVMVTDEDGNENISHYKTVTLITSYDENFSDYIIDFAEAIYERFNFLLSFIQDTESIQDEHGNVKVQKNIRAFVQFIAKHDRAPVAFYSAYPDQSVVQILQNELVRNNELTNASRCPFGH